MPQRASAHGRPKSQVRWPGVACRRRREPARASAGRSSNTPCWIMERRSHRFGGHCYARTVARSVIVSAVRTPFGKLGGSLARKEATELGAIVIRAALDRAGVENDEVEYVIMGQVLQGGAGQAPARQASIGVGLPIEIGSGTGNKGGLSAIRAGGIGGSMIRAGGHPGVRA